MLISEILELIEEARRVRERAFAPMSGFRVGAAVRSESGAVYSAVNVENPTLMLTTCAERSAVLKAVSEEGPELVLTASAVVGPGSEGEGEGCCHPCGSCRQMLLEFGPDMDVYLLSSGGIIRHHIRELLPHAFSPELGCASEHK